MVETDSNPDMIIFNEIKHDSWTGYNIKDFKLDKRWTKSFGTLYYSINPYDRYIEIYNKEDYFELSSDDQKTLFSEITALEDEGYEQVYVVFDFEIRGAEL